MRKTDKLLQQIEKDANEMIKTVRIQSFESLASRLKSKNVSIQVDESPFFKIESIKQGGSGISCNIVGNKDGISAFINKFKNHELE